MAATEHDPSEWERLSQQYRDYARFELSTHGSPIYAAVCAGLADDEPIGGLALAAQPGFRTPLILLAAVHHLLLEGLAHPLASYYPSLSGTDARPIDDLRGSASYRREMVRVCVVRGLGKVVPLTMLNDEAFSRMIGRLVRTRLAALGHALRDA